MALLEATLLDKAEAVLAAHGGLALSADQAQAQTHGVFAAAYMRGWLPAARVLTWQLRSTAG